MSQTPRTDALAETFLRETDGIKDVDIPTVRLLAGHCAQWATLAHQLETELAAMRAKEERLREACKHLHRALSEIDYVCGEPNEMHLSRYDADFDENRVVAAVKAMRERAEKAEAQLAAVQEDAERLDWLTRKISGKALREICEPWPAWSPEYSRAAIDAARRKP